MLEEKNAFEVREWKSSTSDHAVVELQSGIM